MRKLIRALFCLPLALLLFSSCGGNDLDLDVSGIKIEPVKIKRLEQDLFSLDTNKIEEQSAGLQKKYGSFFEKFISGVINDGGIADSIYGASLKRFLGDKDMNDVYKTISSVYTQDEIIDIENELTDAFRHIRYYFPDTTLPKQVITMMSGFHYGIANDDTTLAAGLDFYLGQHAVIYDMMGSIIPAYKRRLMDKKYLSTDMIASWVQYKFDKNEPRKNLLSTMILAGKLYYCTKAILPEKEDSIIVGYTTAQMEYCNEYEKNLWGHLSEKDRLYTNDLKEMVAYTTDGPFTAAISKDCPPAIAKYIGFRIVSSYMKKNPKIKLSDLMAEKDAQKILSKAKYKP